MDDTRRVRLLRLAQTPNSDHKAYYSQYCELINEGLVGWQLGTAFLTDKGKEFLKERYGG